MPDLLDENVRILVDIELFQVEHDLMFLATKHTYEVCSYLADNAVCLG